MAELSSVIEPTPFNPPQAALEDKKKISDAWVVYVSSNHAFPDVQNIGMKESALFYRRRHALIQMRLKESVVAEYREKYGILLKETVEGTGQTVYFSNLIKPKDYAERGPYFHVEFGFHRNGISRAEPERFMEYDEFIATLMDMAVKHREHEIAGCQARRETYAKLRRTKPTGREFREEARRLADELADNTASAEGDDDKLLNLGPRLTSAGVDEYEPVVGTGATRLRSRKCESHDECGVTRDIDGTFIRRYCEGCYHRSHTSAEEIAGVHANEDFDMQVGKLRTYKMKPGRLPTGSPEYTPLDYVRQAYNGAADLISRSKDRSLPSGYYHWSELMLACCHNEQILKLANFEVVRGKIELVLDLSLVRTTVFPLYGLHWIEIVDVRRWRMMSAVGKLVLPTVCEQSKFCLWDRFVDETNVSGFSGGSIAPTQTRLSDVMRPWTCSAVTKPRLSHYKLSKDCLRFLIDGTLVDVVDEEDQVITLNHLKSLHGRDAIAFCNTFFYWRTGGSLRVSRAYAFVNAMYKDLSKVWQVIKVGVAIVSTVYLLYRLIRNSGQMAEADASQSGDIRKTPKSTIPKVVFPQTTPVISTAQGDEQKFVKLKNSFCMISKGTVTMYGARLCSTFVLVPKHLLWYEGDFVVQLCHNGVFS